MSSGPTGDANHRPGLEELRPSLFLFMDQLVPRATDPVQTTIHDKAKMFGPLRTVVADLRRAGVVGLQPTQKPFGQFVARLPNGFVREVEVKQGVGEPEGLSEDRPRCLSAAKLVASGLAPDAGRIVRGKG